MIHISITEPRDLDRPGINYTIQDLLKAGFKTYEIGLELDFIVADPKYLFDKFQVLKNKNAFKIRTK